MLQIIAGLYDEYSGSISYNGIPLGNWCKEDLRSLIGDSLAKEDIFNATLLENITLGKKDITIDKVQDIIAIVGLTDFVASLPERLPLSLLLLPCLPVQATSISGAIGVWQHHQQSEWCGFFLSS